MMERRERSLSKVQHSMMEFKASYFWEMLASDSSVSSAERIADLRADDASVSGSADSAEERADCKEEISSSSGERSRLNSSKSIAELRYASVRRDSFFLL